MPQGISIASTHPPEREAGCSGLRGAVRVGGGVPRYHVQVMDPSFPFVQAWSLSQVTEALVS